MDNSKNQYGIFLPLFGLIVAIVGIPLYCFWALSVGSQPPATATSCPDNYYAEHGECFSSRSHANLYALDNSTATLNFVKGNYYEITIYSDPSYGSYIPILPTSTEKTWSCVVFGNRPLDNGGSMDTVTVKTTGSQTPQSMGFDQCTLQ